jgi:hypothetical protein
MTIHYLDITIFIIVIMLIIVIGIYIYKPIEHIGSNNVLTHSYLFPGIHPTKSHITLVKDKYF